MKSTSLGLSLSFILLAGLNPLTTFAAKDPLPSNLDDYIESGMEEWQLPGLSIAVVKDAEALLVKGYGVQTAGGSDPVDENTLFAVGSTSKAFTSAALGILVDRGEVSWNTRVRDIDPDLKLSDPWITEEIRLSDLPANHSGLSGASESLWYGSGFDREEIIERLQYVSFDEGFRYQYQYRNTMFLLAGEMIPHLVDKSWDDFITQEIFAPLGMDRSLPTDDGIENYTNVAQPHLINYNGQPIPVPYRQMHNIGPAGSIISSAKDFVPWLKVQLGQGEVDLVSEETLRFLHTAQTPMWGISPNGKVRNSPFPLHSYCLGWVTESYQGLRIVWHNGNIDGMSAWVGLVPELGLGVGILTNLDDCEFRKAIFYKIVDHVANIEGEDLDPQLIENHKAIIAHRNQVEKEWQALADASFNPTLPLVDYTGDYHSEIMGTGSVTIQNNRLFFKRTVEQTLELVVDSDGENDFIGRHTNPNEDLRSGKINIEFTEENGTVTSLTDWAEGTPIVFTKVAE
tara:strand:+ start:4304 stop:5842 length:1539 start_codon:yes stop_codon:yes gene_type:complete